MSDKATFPRGAHSGLAAIAEEYGVLAMYVFGSRATEVAQWASREITDLRAGVADVDIGLLLSANKALSVVDKVNLAGALEDLLDVLRVDLVLLPEATPFLALNVIQGELIFCRDEDSVSEYELFVMRRAGDLAPLERERRMQVLKGMTP